MTYVLTTLASFGIILVLSRAGFESEEISDFKGLNRRSPWLAFGVNPNVLISWYSAISWFLR